MVWIFTKTLALSLTVLGIISTLALAVAFLTSTLGLTEAKTPETVTLKDGDSYNLTAEIVKKISMGKK